MYTNDAHAPAALIAANTPFDSPVCSSGTISGTNPVAAVYMTLSATIVSVNAR